MNFSLLLYQNKGYFNLLLLLFVTVNFSANAQIISTVAGTGMGGFNSDGIPATTSYINYASGVALDGSGNLYIADQSNNRIRKVNTNGIITTVAGNGVAGFSGDGGPATSAQLNYPFAVTVDIAGNLYIADTDNHRIRKVSTNGIISTVAGNGIGGFSGDGIATNSSLNYPSGIAVDAVGTMYVADKENQRIRKVTSSGILSTVAGTGNAGFSGDGVAAINSRLYSPVNVIVDGAGNLFIADQANHRVRKVNTSGIINTVAGDGSDGFYGDGGVATSANVGRPAGLAIDGSGNLYISEISRNYVRKVDTNGIISRIAGNGSFGFSGDGVPPTSTRLNTPTGLAVDSSGDVYIADRFNQRIRKISYPSIYLNSPVCRQTSFFEVFYYSTVGGADQYRVTGPGIAPNQIGKLPGQSGSITITYDPGTFTGSFALVVTNTTSGISSKPINGTVAPEASPTRVLVTGGEPFCPNIPSENIGLSDSQSGVNYQLWTGSTAVGSPIAGTGDAISFGNITQANTYTVIGTDVITGCRATMIGSALIGESPIAILTKSGDLSKIMPIVTLTATPFDSQSYQYQFSGPGDPTQNPSANTITVRRPGTYTVVVSNSEGCTSSASIFVDISKIISTVAGKANGGFSGDGLPAIAASLSKPTGVAVDSMGNLYIADQHNHRIRKVDTHGIITTVAGNGTPAFSGDGGAATSASLNYPTGIAFDITGNLYIADQYNHRIRKVSTNGIISTVAGNGNPEFSGDGGAGTSAGLWFPADVTLGASGTVYIADLSNNRVRKVDVSGNITTVAGNGGTAGGLSNGQSATSAAIYNPSGVVLDGEENLYIALNFNHRVIKVSSGGIITILAGNGAGGYDGDGKAATSSNLNVPYGVAVDTQDNTYISDQYNHRIRKVNASGIMSTLAGKEESGFSGDGGLSIEAKLNRPAGIAIDSKGNLYIADKENNRVRRISDLQTIILDSIPPICHQSTSFVIPYASTTGFSNQYVVTGTGISPNQKGSLAGSGRITVSVDPAIFTGNFTIVISDSISGVFSEPLQAAVGFTNSCAVISIKTGDWNDPTTWSLGRVPNVSDQVVLDTGHTVIINGSETARSIEYRTNAQLVFSGSGGTLTLGQ